MLIAIVQHTPVWVWGLLAALTGLGLWQTRDREMTLTRVIVLPMLMIVLSLSGVLTAFGPLPTALGAWVAGVGAALIVGRQLLAVRAARWSAQTGLLHVPGSWLPLVLIVALFSIKYVAGASLAMHPALAHDSTFASVCSLAYGALSGLFLTRAMSLRSLATRSSGLGAT